MPKAFRMFFYLLAFFPLFAGASVPPSAPPVAGLPPHLIAICSIRDWTGKLLRVFSGNVCHFFPDGRLLTANQRFVTLYDKEINPQWRIDESLHHMVTVSDDGKFLYALGSELVKEAAKQVRYDTILKIDLKAGKVLSRFSVREHYAQLRRASSSKETEWPYETNGSFEPRFDLERSHANSVHLLPKTARGGPAYRTGNVLVHLNLLSVIVFLDPDLKKILKVTTRPGKPAQHDVQLLPNGNLLSYVNVNEGGAEKHSSLEEWDPETGKIQWSYNGTGAGRFFSPIAGSVQIVSDRHLLFSDITESGRFVLINREGAKLWTQSTGWVDPKTNRAGAVQGVRAADLTSFLSHNPGI